METRLHLDMLPQPDETTCGPACLYAIYRYYGTDISLERVTSEVKRLKGGGTLEVFLACHALRQGYSALIYTYNLKVFDPTWFVPGTVDIREKLKAQMEAKESPKLRTAIKGYLEFLELGGELRFEDLTTGLIRKYLNRSVPVLAGLSSTYLYRSPREYGPKADWDDIRGVASGHFVVLSGYDPEERSVFVADPLTPNPVSRDHYYAINIDRVICAILLGVLTYDASLLLIRPGRKRQRPESAHPHCS
ncbi:MAG: C39 family peptidase [Thermodesulfovibrionales bacterium]